MPEQARIAEQADMRRHGLERVSADIRSARGVAASADAVLMMQLGIEGVFVRSGIFELDDPEKRACAIVEAVVHYEDADPIARLSFSLGKAMV